MIVNLVMAFLTRRDVNREGSRGPKLGARWLGAGSTTPGWAGRPGEEGRRLSAGLVHG
jgi:hypothetical protein